MQPTAKEIKSVNEVTVIETAASEKVSTIRSVSVNSKLVALQADKSMKTLSTPTAKNYFSLQKTMVESFFIGITVSFSQVAKVCYNRLIFAIITFLILHVTAKKFYECFVL